MKAIHTIYAAMVLTLDALAVAGGPPQDTELLPQADVAGDLYGNAVSFFADTLGETLLVGAPRADRFGADSGNAYLYSRASAFEPFVFEDELAASFWTEAGDEFGWSVAASNAFLGVGSPRAGANDTGAVNVWLDVSGNWSHMPPIVAGDAAPGAQFGKSIAMPGGLLFVGAPGDDDGGEASGSAYVYDFSPWTVSWSLEQKLVPSSHAAVDPEAGKQFGFSVAVDDVSSPTSHYVVVGARYDGELGAEAGAAYVFHDDGMSWSQVAKLTASDGQPGDRMGHAVALAGTRIAVGSHLHDHAAGNAGAVYVYERVGGLWTETHEVADPGASVGALFGTALHLDGEHLVTGARSDDEVALNAGTVSTFQWPLGGTPAWTQRLTPSVEAREDHLGSSVDFDGARVIARSAGDRPVESVTIFREGPAGWEAEAKLAPSDGAGFGSAVAVDGDRALVGDYQQAPGGWAYLYSWDGGQWVEDAKLSGSNVAAPAWYGVSADLDGDYAVVGAPQGDGAAPQSGAAFVLYHDGTGWSEVARLDRPGGVAWDSFGRVVAIDGERIAVASTGANSGVDVFVRDGSSWSHEGAVPAPATPLEVEDLALEGDTLLVGNDDVGQEAGAVHAYAWTGSAWTHLSSFRSNDTIPPDGFGRTVSVSGEVAAVGAPGAAANHQGAVHLFRRFGALWLELEKWELPSAGEWDRFGSSVAIAGGTFCAGAPGRDTYALDTGAAYLRTLTLPLGVNYCSPAVQNSSDDPAIITAWGSTSIATNEFTLEMFRLPASQFGYFITSMSEGYIPQPGGSQGVVCVGGDIGRFQSLIGNSGPAGVISIPIDLSGLFPTNPPQPVLAGQTWNFQGWFRDFNPTQTSNFTDGVKVEFD